MTVDSPTPTLKPMHSSAPRTGARQQEQDLGPLAQLRRWGCRSVGAGGWML